MKFFKEKYEKHIEDFENEIISMVNQAFDRDNYIDPVVFGLIMQDNGEMAITILVGLERLFTSQKGKTAAAELIKGMNQQIKPIAIGFVSEGSMLITEKREDFLNEDGTYKEGFDGVKDHKDAVDVVVLQFETFDKTKNYFYEISGKEGKRTISLKNDTGWLDKDSVNKGGTFSSLLEENYSKLAELLKETLGHELN